MNGDREVRDRLLRLATDACPWREVEESVRAAAGDGVLGGDPLRPYFVQVNGRRVAVQAVRRTGLPDPPLITDLLAGRYGHAAIQNGASVAVGTHYPDALVAELDVASSQELLERLALPHAVLIGLGDRDRYRGTRLPLGVARLASWLRFTHAARVDVLDYSLLSSDPADEVMRYLQPRPDVVGIGVNFGQWRMLADLAGLIERCTASWPVIPVIVIGNILAAFSPAQAAEPFTRARAEGRVLIATGLGERPLEALCRAASEPESWARIPGLVSGSDATDRAVAGASPDGPSRGAGGAVAVPSLVAPDDSLVLTVARKRGQVSLETSLGCQYGTCTFCPRQHKGDGWTRSAPEVCTAVLERWSRVRSPDGAMVALSLADEEFFGSEGLCDPPLPDLPAARILACLADLNVRYELYTRVEQLFDRRRSREWNLERARLLTAAAPHMRRLFAGVESGSPAQLRRYGKGQTLTQTVDALRVASALGVPLEFGFITFDPLLTPAGTGREHRVPGPDRRDVPACGW